ncbi:MAG TPA: hypothetical protein VFV61_06020 [Pyrinomonadaceae bacterium]|nr:hypothetical protein [Pyrinomonadaceae bacterium]
MSANDPLGKLRETRLALLHLHKTLLDDEREAYERVHDRIENSYEVLRLVMHDPWFAWLHDLSELIVRIDESLDAKEPPSEVDVAGVMRQARELTTPDENGGEFQQKYFRALQRSPDAVLAHAETTRLINNLKQQ